MDNIKYTGDYQSFRMYHADVIESTNTYLKENGGSYPDRTVLSAGLQTKGRGRMDHAWTSDRDVCFSILFKEDRFLDIIIPLSVMDALRSLGIKAFIKWPNDVYAEDRKICGILNEAIYEGSTLVSYVSGIGINMTPKPEFDGAGVSEYNGISIEELIRLVLDQIEGKLKENKEYLLEKYKKCNLVMNRRILHLGKEYLVTGFDGEGHLIVSDTEGNPSVIRSDEINIKASMVK